MSHLEELKQKMVIKPNITERERVAVVIKGDKALKRSMDDGNKEKTGNFPVIVDETKKGFDRETLLRKLSENRVSKVTIKQTIVAEKPFATEFTPAPTPLAKKIVKIDTQKPFIIEGEDDDEQGVNEGINEDMNEEFVFEPKQQAPPSKKEGAIEIKLEKPKARKTKKLEKGVAVLGAETILTIGDTDLVKRVPKKEAPVIIKVSSYYMNNREKYVNFINSLFEPYKKELEENTESISCDAIGNTSSDFSLLTHQKLVRDYLNLYTPYRGLLLYHGLGSGKTCTSIAIAEGMKDTKRVVVLTPASLRANYIEELKKCGDLLYKRNQYWEWVSIVDHPESLKTLSSVLNLPMEYIRSHGGAFFINIKKPSNYDTLSDSDKRKLEEQLNEMIKQKYLFINYNGLRSQRLQEMTSGYKKNIFDNSVVVIDEAHNLISRIVNKLKKERAISDEEVRSKKKSSKDAEKASDKKYAEKASDKKEQEKASDKKEKEKEKEQEKEEESDGNIFGDGNSTPLNLATKLYYMLMRAQNARIILLTGTPVVNYPNEFGILFNILRGFIKTWKFPLDIKTTKKVDKAALEQMFVKEKSLDYLDYSPSSKVLTITRNPFGFKNKIKKESGYQGVSNTSKNEKDELVFDNEFVSDEEFERKILAILKRNDIDIVTSGIQVQNKKALPDRFDEFVARYINDSDKTLKNVDALKRRILGLSSYFKSAQESLLPRYNKTLGKDYHVVRVPMSDTQFRIYEEARKQERILEQKKPAPTTVGDLYEEKASTYRIFSRLFCNYVMPERPLPDKKSKLGEKGEKGEKAEDSNILRLLEEGRKLETKQDIEDAREGEIEGDEILENIGGTDYKERLTRAINNLKEHSNDFLTPEALETYSPKFLHILENIQDKDYAGLHLVYSQFRTAEGIGIFTLVLEKNGFAQFKIKRSATGVWEIDMPIEDEGKPTYALYTGTETSEEKEIVRHVYNGEWDQIPDSIGSVLKAKYRNNNMGEVIKVFMITSSGSEGINLRNTRYVHIMDPYWHPVRLEQVIGRARRICSHKSLPEALQTVEVFVYLMIFSDAQLNSDEAVALKRHDLSKAVPKVPFTSDQYLYEISEIKANVTAQLTDAIKESSFDCYIYSNGKCVNFGDPKSDKFSYVPDYAEQQNDTTVKANKKAFTWTGKPINISGVDYVYYRSGKNELKIYDKASYEQALKDPTIVPALIGTLETNKDGQQIFKPLVT